MNMMISYQELVRTFPNKAQNFEVVAQYQFDFGLRPSVAYLQSKGKDLEGYGDRTS